MEFDRNIRIRNLREVRSLEEFASEIVGTACLPRNRRGGSDYISIFPKIENLSNRGGAEVSYVAVNYHFDKGIRGLDCQMRDRVFWREVSSYNIKEDGPVDYKAHLNASIENLKRKIIEIEPKSKVEVGDVAIAVGSRFLEFSGE